VRISGCLAGVTPEYPIMFLFSEKAQLNSLHYFAKFHHPVLQAFLPEQAHLLQISSVIYMREYSDCSCTNFLPDMVI
jgi:hypothetical protein